MPLVPPVDKEEALQTLLFLCKKRKRVIQEEEGCDHGNNDNDANKREEEFAPKRKRKQSGPVSSQYVMNDDSLVRSYRKKPVNFLMKLQRYLKRHYSCFENMGVFSLALAYVDMICVKACANSNCYQNQATAGIETPSHPDTIPANPRTMDPNGSGWMQFLDSYEMPLVCVLIASKFSETDPITISTLADLIPVVSKQTLQTAEVMALDILEWRLDVVTALHFIEIFTESVNPKHLQTALRLSFKNLYFEEFDPAVVATAVLGPWVAPSLNIIMDHQEEEVQECSLRLVTGYASSSSFCASSLACIPSSLLLCGGGCLFNSSSTLAADNPASCLSNTTNSSTTALLVTVNPSPEEPPPSYLKASSSCCCTTTNAQPKDDLLILKQMAQIDILSSQRNDSS